MSQSVAQVSFASVHVITDLSAIPAGLFASGSVVTIGNFDGIHLGHQHIVSATVARASEIGMPSVALTFDPHPSTPLCPERPLRRSALFLLRCFQLSS